MTTGYPLVRGWTKRLNGIRERDLLWRLTAPAPTIVRVLCSSQGSPIEKQGLVRTKHQVSVDDDAYWQRWAFGQRGLDVHVAPGHLLPYLVHTVLQTVPASDDDAITILAILGRSQLGTDAQQRRQHRAGEDAIPVPIDTVLQTGVAGRVGTLASARMCLAG